MDRRSSFVIAATLLGCSTDEPCDAEAPGTICTVAGTGDRGFAGDFGPATAAWLHVPHDIAVAPDGRLWILDFNNHRVRRINADATIETVVGNGVVGDSPASGGEPVPALEAAFDLTSDLVFHDGFVYLAAWSTSRIKRVRIADMMLENYAGVGRRLFYDGDGGDRLAASLDLPASVAVTPFGGIAIMDQASQVIREVTPDGTIDRIAGSCVIDFDVRCAPDQDAVQCPGSNKTTCGDVAIECSRECTPGFAGEGTPALDARLAQPFGQATDPGGGLAYDSAGNLIFADPDNHRIRKVDTAGIITTLAGIGEPGYAGDGGLATAARIDRPFDVEIGADGSVFFTDSNNNCIRKIDPAGIITAVVGRCTGGRPGGFAGDGGPPTDAVLDRPHGIELHGGKLYIADSYNNRIRVVNL